MSRPSSTSLVGCHFKKVIAVLLALAMMAQFDFAMMATMAPVTVMMAVMTKRLIMLQIGGIKAQVSGLVYWLRRWGTWWREDAKTSHCNWRPKLRQCRDRITWNDGCSKRICVDWMQMCLRRQDFDVFRINEIGELTFFWRRYFYARQYFVSVSQPWQTPDPISKYLGRDCALEKK